jgi:hypothetical protein
MASTTIDLVYEVGEAYLSAESAGHRALVTTAYEHLQAETDALFYLLVNSDVADPLRVVFTRCREPYASDTELIAAVRASRVLEITTAATSASRLHPTLGCGYGGPFDRFRAVHDAIGHAGTGLGFDLGDEIAAWHVQDRLHGALAGWALATELLGVNCARSVIGEAPEQKAMLLEPRLLESSRARFLAADAGPRRTRRSAAEMCLVLPAVAGS